MSILTVTLHPALDKLLRVARLRPNDTARASIEKIYGGGKGNNVARALVRLGLPVTATGFQGGYTGAYITHELAAEGIRTEFVTCRQPTRTSLILHEGETGLTYAVYEPGQEVELDEVQALMATFERLLDTCKLALLCGSGQTAWLTPVYAEMIEVARQRGVRCVLDSSGQALARGLQARPSMVKINSEELAEVIGRPLPDKNEQVRAIQELQGQGIAVVVLTRGADGILATASGETWEGRLPMPQVLNVVGCGDSTLAGIAYAGLQGVNLDEMVRWGMACGAANTQSLGAGFIELDLVERLRPQVTLQRVM